VKVLITGAGGQLGKEFIAYFTAKGDTLYSFTRKELDVTDATSLNPIMKSLKPDLVLHCAAYTKVDAAEENWKEAYAVNALGTRNIAVASEVIGAKLVYFSTIMYLMECKRVIITNLIKQILLMYMVLPS